MCDHADARLELNSIQVLRTLCPSYKILSEFEHTIKIRFNKPHMTDLLRNYCRLPPHTADNNTVLTLIKLNSDNQLFHDKC